MKLGYNRVALGFVVLVMAAAVGIMAYFSPSGPEGSFGSESRPAADPIRFISAAMEEDNDDAAVAAGLVAGPVGGVDAGVRVGIVPGLPGEHLIDAEAMSQFPELFNGCEITSLAMLVQYMGLPYGREELIAMLALDPTPVRFDEAGAVAEWGDPDLGFVGDIIGNTMGYGVYHKPIADILDRIWEHGASDLTGEPYMRLEQTVSVGRPVIVWTTSEFAPTDEWVEWRTPEGRTVSATFHEHAVLLVGYDPEYVYVNDPLTGEQARRTPKAEFVESWQQLGRQAVTFQ